MFALNLEPTPSPISGTGLAAVDKRKTVASAKTAYSLSRLWDRFLISDARRVPRSLGTVIVSLAPALVFLNALMFVSSSVGAQVKYSPDDEVVQNVAEKAAQALESAKSDTAGQLALGALAIVETGKRYTESVPRDSKTVQAAIKQILDDLPKSGDKLKGPIAENNETYYPAVALILLCEVDDQKYQSEIELLIKILLKRQRNTGAFTYTKDKAQGDTSQMQYAALAMFVADQHQFEINPEAAKAALTWLTGTQQSDGTFRYKINDPRASAPRGRPTTASPPNPSIQSAGIGTVYLLADMLQLSTRSKRTAVSAEELEGQAFPPGVSIYVKPRDDGVKEKRTGPLVNFDPRRLGGSRSAGNKVMEQMFQIPIRRWNYYYMYAFERYAYFRAETEGNMGRGKMKRWYDEGVDYLIKEQKPSGVFPNGANGLATSYVNTAFAILFLVRSSEILVRPSADSELVGDLGFPEDEQLTESNGRFQSNSAQEDLSEQLKLLQAGSLDDSDLQVLANKSMRKALNAFRNDDKKNRGSLDAFLRTMISDRNHHRRRISVRFLAGEQDLDNVPALLYALGDPDYEVAFEAHNGLRLVSRKIDSITLDRIAEPPFPNDPKVLDQVKLEYQRVKERWTDWYLKLKPNAKLLD